MAHCFSQRVTLKQYRTDDGERDRIKGVKDGVKIPSLASVEAPLRAAINLNT